MFSKQDHAARQENLANFTALRDALAELDMLTAAQDGGKSKEHRVKFLLSKIAALRSGYGVDELNRAGLIASIPDDDPTITGRSDGTRRQIASDFARRDNAPLTGEQRAFADAWRTFVRNGGVLEARDLGAGNPGNPVSLSAGSSVLGAFLPTEFFYSLTRVLKVHSPLFDDEFCTVVRTSHGRPIQVGYVADTDNVAAKINEGSSATEADPNTGGVMVFVDAYRTPMFKASREALEDVDLSFGVAAMASDFLGDRFARGAGKDLLLGATANGQNSATPGLVPRLRTAGAVTVVAAGSNNVTGDAADTASNSIGAEDLSRLFFSVNALYRKSLKCAWLMHPNTLQRLNALHTKQGMKLNLVEWREDGRPYIFGRCVYEDPNMDVSHAGAFTVVFGDFSYWVTRVALDGSRVQTYTEAPGLVENGKFGLRLFGRAGGDLRFGSSLTSPATSPYTLVELPLVMLQQG
ncbi:MAG: hypothetical protein AUH28_16320 [Acidobacteria bacterium 13_1_40CM_56_16]|nr:MAG: hypothetical protein AUH28_16320 [Acidobacteria bacterium 13_1_40CM_56_16]